MTGTDDEAVYWGASAGRVDGKHNQVFVYATPQDLEHQLDMHVYLLDLSDTARTGLVADAVVASWPHLTPGVFTGTNFGDLGDVNGQGFRDVYVSGYDCTEYPDLVTAGLGVYRGPVQGEHRLTDADAYWEFVNPRLAGAAGDFDADGSVDLIEEDGTHLYLVDPSAQGVLAPADATLLLGTEFLRSDGHGGYGSCDASMTGGDLDGDGYDDLVLSCYTSFDDGEYDDVPQTALATVFRGPLAGRYQTALDATTTFTVPFGDEAKYGGGATVLDFDGDGTLDLALGAPYAPDDQFEFRGGVGVFYGPDEGGTVDWYDADAIYWGEVDHGDVGYTRALDHGDFNLDGSDDLVIGAGFTRGTGAAAWVVYGGGSF